jgi:hypothetical protein
MVALLVGAYIAFVVWRIRVHRQRDAQRARDEAPSEPPTKPPTDAGRTQPSPAGAAVKDVLEGIALPLGLVPLVTMGPRPEAIDRVAFWTADAPAPAVRDALYVELDRLGAVVEPVDELTVAAVRNGGRAIVHLHPDGALARVDGETMFPSVPAGAVVVEFWT